MEGHGDMVPSGFRDLYSAETMFAADLSDKCQSGHRRRRVLVDFLKSTQEFGSGAAAHASNAVMNRFGVFLLGLACATAAAQGNASDNPQLVSSSGLPDDPSALLGLGQQNTASQNSAAASPASGPHQTKRILGVIPNFRSVSSDQHLPPQTPKDKLTVSFEDSFDYSAFIFVAAESGVAFAEKSDPEFHQGAAGYGRYYWHTFADQADENIWVEGLLPVVLHQDNRYYTKGHGNPFYRAGYAITRVLVTRNDDGNETFNSSEIAGAGTASAISSLYYPSQERDWTKVGQRWLTNVLIDGGVFVFKEFWPDINGAVFHQKD